MHAFPFIITSYIPHTRVRNDDGSEYEYEYEYEYVYEYEYEFAVVPSSRTAGVHSSSDYLIVGW